MYDTDEDETQRGLRPWLPPSRGVGWGRGLLAAGQWSPDSTEVVGRTTYVSWHGPLGIRAIQGRRPACPVDETVTFRPAAPWPGSVVDRDGRRVAKLTVSKTAIMRRECTQLCNTLWRTRVDIKL